MKNGTKSCQRSHLTRLTASRQKSLLQKSNDKTQANSAGCSRISNLGKNVQHDLVWSQNDKSESCSPSLLSRTKIYVSAILQHECGNLQTPNDIKKLQHGFKYFPSWNEQNCFWSKKTEPSSPPNCTALNQIYCIGSRRASSTFVASPLLVFFISSHQCQILGYGLQK